MDDLELLALICEELNIMQIYGRIRKEEDIALLRDMAEAMLEQEGWHKNSISDEWQKD